MIRLRCTTSSPQEGVGTPLIANERLIRERALRELININQHTQMRCKVFSCLANAQPVAANCFMQPTTNITKTDSFLAASH
jgi:hypothetical protein